MTDDELKAIEARANAATPGPWTSDAERPEKHAITLRRADGMVLCEFATDVDVVSGLIGKQHGIRGGNG